MFALDFTTRRGIIQNSRAWPCSRFLKILIPPPQSTTVHILHDNTLTAENREKFILIADRYGQSVKFYNVEELCKEELSKITRKISSARSSYFTIAAYYRTLIPDVLSSAIEKCIYLDSDIVINMDIKELWQIDLGQKILGVVTSKSDDRKLDYNLCIEGIVKFEDYLFGRLVDEYGRSSSRKKTDV